MRSVGRLLQAAARSAAAPQVPTRRMAGASAAPSAAAAGGAASAKLAYLRQGIEYEVEHRYPNMQGKLATFDQFLIGELTAQSQQLPVLKPYLRLAQQYSGMSSERRAQLCNELLKLTESVGSGSGGAGGGGSMAERAAASLQAKAARAAAVEAEVGAPAQETNGAAATSSSGALAHQPQQPVQSAAAQVAEAAQPSLDTHNGTADGIAGTAGAAETAAATAAVNGSVPETTPATSGAAAAAAAAAADPLAAQQPDAQPSFTSEWGLSLEEQQQQPFQAPDLTTLQHPVPVLFDLETSGRAVGKAHVVELAALDAQSGAEFCFRVRLPAGEAMEDGATGVNGISTQDAQSNVHPDWDKVYTHFFGVLAEAVAAAGPGGYLLLCGHNIKNFDLPILLHRARAAGLPLLRHARFLDTYVLAKAVQPTGEPMAPPNRKLGTLFEYYTGEPPEAAHRALADCQSNLVVLQRLLAKTDGVPAGAELASQLHAAAMQEGVDWGGWVGQLPAATGQEATKPAPTKTGPTTRRQRASKLGPAVSILDTLAEGGLPAGEEVAGWEAARDPLSLVESAGRRAPGAAGTAGTAGVAGTLSHDEDEEAGEAGGGVPVPAMTTEERRAQVAAVQEGWNAVVADDSLRTSFLSTPLTQLNKKGQFTAKQAEALEGGKVFTLRQLLECYPSRLITSQPGRLPEESDEDAVATLAVRLKKKPLLRQSGGMAWYLSVQLRVVHPSEAGLEAAWMPEDAYADRDIQLEIYDYKRGGRFVQVGLRKALEKLVEAGDTFVVSGRVRLLPLDRTGSTDTWRLSPGYTILLPEVARAAFGQQEPTAQVAAVHPSRGGVTPSQMQRMVDKGLAIAEAAAAKDVPLEPLPDWILSTYDLPGLLPALRAMHRPGGEEELEQARQRLAFQEFLALQLKLLVQRNLAWRDATGGSGGVAIGDRGTQLLELGRECLGFTLTAGQESALEEILGQMAGWPPMQCLLQGDVGCGKTAVALLALLAASGAGYQGAIMAPTEILADQHHRNLVQLVQRMNREVTVRKLTGFQLPRIALVTGSVKGKTRAVLNEALSRGDIDIAVGTHALISESTQFARLGLVVVDEQHKFGVEQRGRLLAKASPAPHVLHMTATPIPRTQALIDHGDMSQVVILDLPAGRSPVVTRMLEDGTRKRLEMYEHIREEMALGHGIYIVCPFVEESDKLEEIKAATGELQRLLSEGVFEEEDCGLLHGQLRPEEKEAVLQRFKAGSIQVLVSTTVVEVGVDVPQATVMVIEHAERFGFAQLHQLRGRVGRSERQSYCYLVYSRKSGGAAMKKMKVLVNCSNGFAVAECDLEHRGAGEVLGKRQSGQNLRTMFKAAQIPGDRELLEAAREAASRLLAQQPDPRQWPAELRGLVADDTLLQLDTHSMPSLAP